MEKPLVYIDFESTGVDPKTDRIVEIAMVKVMPDGRRIEKHYRVNPEVLIPKAASDIHGITNEMVSLEPTFKQLSVGLFSFIKDCDIATYNGNNFDIPLLYCELSRAGIEWDYYGVNFIDACVIFKRQESRTLSAASRFYLGKPLEGAHGALADVNCTIDVLMSQLDKYADLPKDPKELSIYCNYDKPLCDIGGYFVQDSQGDYILNFGKHKGELAKNQRVYLEWMIKGDFLPDAKLIAKKILNQKEYTQTKFI